VPPATLFAAVEAGDLAAITAAVAADPAAVTHRSDDGDTLLHLACWQKQAAIAMTLLAHGADVAARGCYGRTPLHYAVHEGDSRSVALVATLLARGADPGATDDLGHTVAAWARIELDDGLAEVLALLDRPQAAVAPTAPPPSTPPPGCRLGALGELRRARPDAPARLMLTLVGPGFARGGEIDVDATALRRWRDDLADLATVGTATWRVTRELTLAARADGAGAALRWDSARSQSPPGRAACHHHQVALDAAGLEALLAGLDRLIAG
jgi:hypothetical protein